ncbi:MAG: GDSL-type esterase/lipase family protein [Capsulimonadaceae bacterium]|nr:GDSL-type esterase/lipase family protein [Capsulimonadaceae bacterium]
MNCYNNAGRFARALSLILIAALFCAVFSAAQAQSISIRNNQKVAFLGDSITHYGWSEPKGYVHLVVDCLAANGVSVVPVPAGVSGNTSQDMLARLDRDVLSKTPDWMTLSCGVNDVWHGDRGVAFAPYMTNISSIVDKARAANVKVIILTATPIMEDLGNDNNKKLAYYNDFLRYLASQKGCILADLNKGMADVISTKTAPGNYATRDGVHMNELGNQVMATGILKAIGLTDEQIAKTIPALPKPVVKISSNLALGKPFVCSDPNQSGWNGLTDGAWSTTAPGCFATGKTDTFPKTVTIDLQQAVSIASVVTATVPASSTKTVELSVSQSPDSDFKVVGSHVFVQNQDEKYTYSFPAVTARYVRLKFADHYAAGIYDPLHVFLTEAEVYAPAPAAAK